MAQRSTFLVLGATGRTGKHFVAHALAQGHSVRALVRAPAKLGAMADKIQVTPGSITDDIDADTLVDGIDYVVVMVGDREAQQKNRIVAPFIEKLVPSMRRHGVKRLFYQAGGFSRPYGGSLGILLWTLRNTVARGSIGQHEDNEAVMEYLATQAMDIEWMVCRAGIGSDGPSKGVLIRSSSSPSIATHVDCAEYAYRTVMDPSAVHTSEFSRYSKV